MLCKDLIHFIAKSLFLFIIPLFISIPPKAFSEFKITKIAFEGNFLILSVSSDPTNYVDMKRIIEDGINLKIIYEFDIYKKNPLFFPDMLLTNINMEYKCKKDIINNGFESILSNQNELKSKWFPGILDMIDYVSSIKNVKIIPIDSLDEDSHYYLVAKQEIISMELFPPLSFIYSLMGRWNYTSGKLQSKYFNKNGIINE